MAKEPKQDWKMYQQTYYHLLVQKPGIQNHQKLTYNVERVKSALRLLWPRQSEWCVQPARSRMVAIVYATLIEKIYGEDFYDTLNDENLFLGSDDFFQPYLQDSDVYDKIIEQLALIPDWMEKGCIPEFVRQFNLQCTQEGIDSIKSNSMTV